MWSGCSQEDREIDKVKFQPVSTPCINILQSVNKKDNPIEKSAKDKDKLFTEAQIQMTNEH